jgi:hypothetical protein
MINVEHNFTENFLNAVGFNDEFMVKDIIIDEMARQIVENKPDVVKLLRSNNLNATVRDNDSVIANIIINEIQKGNENIINGMSNMIAKNRFDKPTYDTKFKQATGQYNALDDTSAGQTSTTQNKTFWTNLKTVLQNENVQSSISDLISAGLKRAYSKDSPQTTQENAANLNERLKINQMKKQKKIDYKKLIIFTGVSLLVGVLVIKIVQLKKQNIE